MMTRKLHGPLDGLLKATYSERDAELTLSYGGRDRITLDEWDLDALLRMMECSPSDEQADADAAEFLEDVGGVSRVAAARMAQWMVVHQAELDELVYA